ncbi:MAG: hypothetical protein Q8P67_03765, partial [archaeon]|nr:hypothetical protein [archaeon]
MNLGNLLNPMSFTRMRAKSNPPKMQSLADPSSSTPPFVAYSSPSSTPLSSPIPLEDAGEQPFVRCLAIITGEVAFHGKYYSCKKCHCANVCLDCRKECHTHPDTPGRPRSRSPTGKIKETVGCLTCDCPCRVASKPLRSAKAPSASPSSSSSSPAPPSGTSLSSSTGRQAERLDLAVPLGLGLWYTFSGLITYWAMAGTVPLSTSLQYLVLTLLPLHKLHGSIKTGLQKEAVLVGGSWAADELEVTWDAFKLHIQLDSGGNITASTLRRAVHLTFLDALASEPAETATLQLRGQQLDWPAYSSTSALPSDLSSPPTVSRSYDRSLDLSSSNRDSLDRTTGRAFDRQTQSPNRFDRPPVPPRGPAFNLLALCEPRLAAKLADIDIGAHGLLFDDGPSDYTHFEEIDMPCCSQNGTGQTVERPSLSGTPVGLVFAEPEPGRSDEVLDPPIPIRSTLEARKKKIAGLDLRMLIPVSFWSFGKAPEGVDISEPLPPGIQTTVDSPRTFISSPASSTASPVGLHSSTPPPLPPRSSTFPTPTSTAPPPIVLPREPTTSSTPTTSTIAESAGEMDGPPSLLLTKSEQTLDVDIKGGTLLELTYSLFSPPSGVSRNSVEEVFLYTYTSFTNPHQLLQLLLSLYDESESEPNPGVFRLRLCG